MKRQAQSLRKIFAKYISDEWTDNQNIQRIQFKTSKRAGGVAPVVEQLPG
jgi:hypothetical protein